MAESLESRTLFAANDLDATFNGDGVNVSLPGVFNATQVLSDGKVLAAGYLKEGTKSSFLVARFTAAGKLDTSFGGGDGWASITGGASTTSGATAMVLGPGGKIYLAGSSSTLNASGNPTASVFMVACFTSNGIADSTFGGGGRVTTSFGSTADAKANAAAITSSGKIVVVGSVKGNLSIWDRNIAFARYNSNGSLDTSFSGDGKLVSTAGDSSVVGVVSVGGLAIQSDGKMVVVGDIDVKGVPIYQDGEYTGDSDLFIARYTAAGNLDTSFSGDGWNRTKCAPSATVETLNDVKILPNGKIVAVGYSAQHPDLSIEWRSAIVQYNANGSLDTTFGGGLAQGFTLTDIHSKARDEANALVVQPDGKFVVVGRTDIVDTLLDQLYVVRYLSTGLRDVSFSSDGIQTYPRISGGNAAAMGENGKLVVAGDVTGNSFDSKAAVARFQADSAASASVSGIVYEDVNGNGVKNLGELPLAGWLVYIDSNNDGFLTPGEQVTTTGRDGSYRLSVALVGKYRIREVRLDGWDRTQPAGTHPLGFYDVSVGRGSLIIGRDFGNKRL